MRLRPPEHHEEAEELQPERDLGPEIARSAPSTGQKAHYRRNVATHTRSSYSGAFPSPSSTGGAGEEGSGVARSLGGASQVMFKIGRAHV